MRWFYWALLSAFFAGITAILAKVGIAGVNSNLATAIRTTVVLIFTWGIALATTNLAAVNTLPRRTWIFLIFSGLATGLSWLCYFRALQLGEVSRVAPVDKLSVVFTIVLAVTFLYERLTWQHWIGGALVVSGALVFYAGYTIQHANLRTVAKGKVYRSGQMNAAQLSRAIQDFGLKSILNLRGENLATAWHQTEIAISKKLNVVHCDRSLGSGDELTLEQMDELVRQLQQAPKPVLIRCLGGADRSGLVCALYEVAIEGQTLEAADREISIWCGHGPLIRAKLLATDRSF